MSLFVNLQRPAAPPMSQNKRDFTRATGDAGRWRGGLKDVELLRRRRTPVASAMHHLCNSNHRRSCATWAPVQRALSCADRQILRGGWKSSINCQETALQRFSHTRAQVLPSCRKHSRSCKMERHSLDDRAQGCIATELTKHAIVDLGLLTNSELFLLVR